MSMITANGKEVSAKDLSRFLGDIRRDEMYEKLSDLSDRELCEAVRTHFETYTTRPGEKGLKDQVNKLLKDEEFTLSESERADIQRGYADTRVREFPISRDFAPGDLKCERVDQAFRDDKVDNVVNIDKVNVELRNRMSDVEIWAEQEGEGRRKLIGTLPEKFFAHNMVAVDSCNAELQIVDYSNGKMKNISASVVFDTAVLSGDAVELDADMLTGLDQKSELEQ